MAARKYLKKENDDQKSTNNKRESQKCDDKKILSDDLLLQLRGIEEGNDDDNKSTGADSLILTGKRQRLRSSKDELHSQVIEEKAVKLSKAGRKRELQILRRKDSEKKRDSFIETIHANVITEQERDLLTSSKQIGHGSSLSLKYLLSRLLKRKRAGLQLTPEETDLLYAKGSGKTEYSMSFQQSIAEVTVECIQTEVIQKAESDTDQLFFTCLPTIPSNDVQVKPKKKRKKVSKEDDTEEQCVSNEAIESQPILTSKSVETHGQESQQKSSISTQPIVAATVLEMGPSTSEEAKPAGSLGLSLLQQLKNIASKNSHSIADREIASQPSLISSLDNSAAPAEAVVEKVYIPEETTIPVSAAGNIIVVPQHDKGAGTTKPSEPKPVKSKKSVFVERPEDVSLSRMNLPICSMEQEIVEAILAHDVVILCGETGSGKSTQVIELLPYCVSTISIL